MDNELRVLQYVRVLDNGGIESLIFNLLDKTDRNILNYDFLLTRNQIESHENDIIKYGCKKIVVNIDLSGNLFSRYRNIYKCLLQYFRSCPYKIVHFQAVGTSFGGSLAILAAKKAGITVRIVHAHSAYTKSSLFRKADICLGQFLHRRWGTHFMACSEKAAQFSFGKNYSKYCCVTILKNGIDVNKFKYNEKERNLVRSELNIDNRFVIGSIGRLSPAKNHLFMLDIMSEIIKLRNDAVLVIVGSNSASHEEYAEMIRQKIQNSMLKEHVIFVGERQDAYRLYNGFDVFLFPSLWEGLGIAAIEAQANGLPVYASDMIPREASITNNFHYLSLKANAEEWAKRICSNDNLRRDECDIIVSKGYDIAESAEKLSNYYWSLYNGY